LELSPKLHRQVFSYEVLRMRLLSSLPAHPRRGDGPYKIRKARGPPFCNSSLFTCVYLKPSKFPPNSLQSLPEAKNRQGSEQSHSKR
jgi:hypothetical protein